MNSRFKMFFLTIPLLLQVSIFISGCSKDFVTYTKLIEENTAKEVSVNQIILTGEAGTSDAEMSGLTWYQDNLFLLLQYPHRFTDISGTGKFFKLSKAYINDYINGYFTSLEPVSVLVTNIPQNIDGFEGFEAIAFKENNVYLLLEAKQNSVACGYIISGIINSNASEITLDTTSLIKIDTPADVGNASFESIVLTDNYILCIFEGNGKNINTNPVAKVFNYELIEQPEIVFPSVEYRITDATAITADKSFYVINYYYPGDSSVYLPSYDEFSCIFDRPGSHKEEKRTERIIKLRYYNNRIEFVNVPPVYLELRNDNLSRNWEGIELLSENTFLIVTDKFHDTFLGYFKQ